MLLPYDTTMSYWMMAVPQFEWQPEPPGVGVTSVVQDSPGDAIMDPTGSVGPALPLDPTAEAGAADRDSADGPGEGAPRPRSMPQLRLVMTGMHWVVVPYWSPRENANWNLMADEARETDKERTETTTRQAKRSADINGAENPTPTLGARGAAGSVDVAGDADVVAGAKSG